MTRDDPIEYERMCPKCGERKPITDFARNRSRPDGRAAYCRPCHTARQREYYATPEGKAAVRAAQRRSIERGKARYAAAVAKLAPEDRAKLGLA